MPMRIAFVFTHRIQYFTNLMDALQRRGSTQVAAFYAHETARIDDPGFGRRIAWDNCPAAAFSEMVLPGSSRRRHGPFQASYDRGFPAALSRFAPEAVHLNGYNSAVQWQGLFWARRRGVPVLARGDGDTLSGTRRQALAPQALLAGYFARSVTHVFHQGIENEKFWLARGVPPARLSWVPCVSDGKVFRRQAFADEAARVAFRETLGARAGDVVFVVSGKLEARKRPADAIEALARCPSPRARLWFLGSGPLEGELRELARARGADQRITWLGFRNQTELPAVLQAADVLVHPSEKDPWPYSILEGAISGLALLLSNRVGSHPDLIGWAGAGRVFRVADAAELAEDISVLASDDALRAAYQRAATAAAARYTETEFCERFEEVVETVRRGGGL